ncbi:MAG TPA: ComF family protein [Atribacteraceae bacterium]|nr:ComF family protein [Atribacteraceae bacterium]
MGEGLGEGFLNFFFPLHCVVCGAYIRHSSGFPLCGKCLESIRYIRSPLCPICGRPLDNPRVITCRRCRTAVPRLDLTRSIAYYVTPVREALHAWKYGRMTSLGKLFESLVVSYLEVNPFLREVDGILPVPLHPSRRQERGFNQAEVLVRSAAKAFNLPVFSGAVQRIRKTPPQPGLTPRERRKNLAGAFSVTATTRVRERRILIVDDVVTSRATLESLAGVLRKAGVSRLYALTVASGRPLDDLLRPSVKKGEDGV